MPDFLDRAAVTVDQTLAANLQAQAERAASEPQIAASGVCHNIRCGEEFPAGDNRLFCDSLCAAEHARHIRK